MTNFPRALIYLVVFAVLTTAGGLFINNAIDRPVKDVNHTYTAEFINAAGLKVGNDVRYRGARIGKVTDISIHHDAAAATSYARVQFELSGDAQVYDNSQLAIRYLNLTGIRYLDIQDAIDEDDTQTPDEAADTTSANGPAGIPVADDEIIPISSTTPSFDVTRVFHGLAPVFDTMNPDDINHFAESLLAVIEGDGTSFPEFVSSLTQIMELVDDRSAIITTLVDNLAELSGAVEGRAQYIDPIIAYVSRFGTVLAQWTPDLRSLADETGEIFVQADYLLAALGLRPNRTPDAEFFIDQLEPLGEFAIGLLALTPGILQSINSVLPPTDAGAVDRSCSKGEAEIPADLKLFLQGSEVTLCKR